MDFARNVTNSGANYFGCSLIYVLGQFCGNIGQDRMWVLFIRCFDSNFKEDDEFDRCNGELNNSDA